MVAQATPFTGGVTATDANWPLRTRPEDFQSLMEMTNLRNMVRRAIRFESVTSARVVLVEMLRDLDHVANLANQVGSRDESD